ncbi:MAG: DUF4349 domain-containing protein [Candidatus Omnitrophota bacterium]
MFNRHVISQLSGYLDNQLSDREKIKIEEHLKDCIACAQELDKLRLISKELKTWQAPDLERGFEGSVTNSIVNWELKRGRVTMKRKHLAILIPSGALVGILALAFVLNFMIPHTQRGINERLKSPKDDIRAIFSGEEPGYSGMRKSEMSASLSGREKMYKYATRGELTAGAGDRDYNYKRQGRIDDGGNVLPDVPGEEGSIIIVQPVLPATSESDLVIRTGNISLEVDNGKQAYQNITKLCQELGGYISQSNFYKNNEGREAGTVTMRIPKDKFTTALEKLANLGKVTNSTSDSKDVSQEYANLKSRLETAKIVYEKMLEALRNRKATIPEAMRIESELSPVLRNIEDLKNKIETLNNAVSFTTITVNFYEPVISAKALKESKRIIKEKALATAINTVKFLAAAIPVAVIIGFWVLVVAGLILAIKYFIAKLTKRD